MSQGCVITDIYYLSTGARKVHSIGVMSIYIIYKFIIFFFFFS